MHHVAMRGSRQTRFDAAGCNLHVTILHFPVCTMRPTLQAFLCNWQPWSMTESTPLISVAVPLQKVLTGIDDNGMSVRAFSLQRQWKHQV